MAPPVVRKGCLAVYLLGRKVGLLEYSSHHNEMRFRYDVDYLSDSRAIPLSYALPLQDGEFDSERTTVFFENLLPPDSVRRKLGPVLHLSRHNVFGFLEALGGDCAGAIALWPEGHVPSHEEEHLLPLSEDAADSVLKALKKHPLYVNGVDGYRISGAGAQNKLIARISADGGVSLPLFGTPSTHLIKPSVADYPDTIYNEHFAMQLAKNIGLSAASSGLMRIKGVVYYWTERYDRELKDGRIVRLHQEDFCQILGVAGEMKYESEGGPDFRHCLQVMKEMRLGLNHLLAFVDRMIFNFLIGNADAHGKNSSILYRDGKAGLAPIYDVMSTVIYPKLSKINAMSIGGTNRMADVTRASFEAMADEAGLRPALVLGRLDAMLEKIGSTARELAENLNSAWPSDVYDRIVKVIDMQSAQVSRG